MSEYKTRHPRMRVSYKLVRDILMLSPSYLPCEAIFRGLSEDRSLRTNVRLRIDYRASLFFPIDGFSFCANLKLSHLQYNTGK